MDYIGNRRKRNLNLARCYQTESIEKDAWEQEELEEGYEMEEIEDTDLESKEWKDSETQEEVTHGKLEQETFFLNGKIFIPKQKQKKETFADSHVRITTYLEKNVHQIIRMLQKQGQIESITKLVNDSIKEYLMKEYSNNSNFAD